MNFTLKELLRKLELTEKEFIEDINTALEKYNVKVTELSDNDDRGLYDFINLDSGNAPFSKLLRIGELCFEIVWYGYRAAGKGVGPYDDVILGLNLQADDEFSRGWFYPIWSGELMDECPKNAKKLTDLSQLQNIQSRETPYDKTA